MDMWAWKYLKDVQSSIKPESLSVGERQGQERAGGHSQVSVGLWLGCGPEQSEFL